jgi:cytochrome c oxidase subunit 3
MQLPLVNTGLLLLSGVMVTGAHHTLMVRQDARAFLYLFLTIVLGITFLACQFYEYKYGVQFS